MAKRVGSKRPRPCDGHRAGAISTGRICQLPVVCLEGDASSSPGRSDGESIAKRGCDGAQPSRMTFHTRQPPTNRCTAQNVARTPTVGVTPNFW